MSRVAEDYCYRPRRSGRLVAVSQGVARELREFFPAMAGSVVVIPNGVDRDAFAPAAAERRRLRSEWGVADGELVALFVGGEWERKGLRYALEGVAAAPGWRLVVVGAGDRERFERMAEALGAADRVRFEGATTDTNPYYASADGFILPTAYETFSLVTYEAAAAGLPLLVSRVSGVDEILVDGKNGWYIDRDADVIARRLIELRHESLRRAMGEAAREDSARFTWDSAVGAYDRLYRGLAAEVSGE
jgi:UDP-glucose:(heptosyl)LPS alpha-1,3-glucosyltransferase